EVGSAVRDDGIESAVPGRPPTTFDAYAAELEVQVVVDHDQLLNFRRWLQVGEHVAAEVHVHLWFDQHSHFAGDGPLRAPRTIPLRSQHQPPTAQQLVDHGEADIVAGRLISVPRISEPDDNAHRRLGRGALLFAFGFGGFGSRGTFGDDSLNRCG